MQQEISKKSKSPSTIESAINTFYDLFPKPNVNPEELSTDALAYLGDAVFNLYAKIHTLSDIKVTQLHKMANKYISREGQSKILKALYPLLTEKEALIVRRGINSKGAKKHGNDLMYKESTGFEALVGFLFLSDRIRLTYLLKEGLKQEEM